MRSSLSKTPDTKSVVLTAGRSAHDCRARKRSPTCLAPARCSASDEVGNFHRAQSRQLLRADVYSGNCSRLSPDTYFRLLVSTLTGTANALAIFTILSKPTFRSPRSNSPGRTNRSGISRNAAWTTGVPSIRIECPKDGGKSDVAVAAAKCPLSLGDNAPFKPCVGSLVARPVAIAYRNTRPQVATALCATSRELFSMRRITRAVISAIGRGPTYGRYTFEQTHET